MSRPSKSRRNIPILIFLLLVILAAGAAFFVVEHKKNQRQREQQKVEAEAKEMETTPEPTMEPTESPTPEQTPEPERQGSEDVDEAEYFQNLVPEEVNLPGTGKCVAIDPGHQRKGNSNLEPIGPGASKQKPQVASGTTGRTTGVPEYQLNLDVSLKLRDELETRGYTVYMIRESNDVDISNSERAKLAADSGADILVRIHANGSENSSVSGALTMAPSAENSFMESELVEQCRRLSESIIQSFCEVTGAGNQGVYLTDEMSGLNWCTIPATIVELGYMTNPEEDTKMQTEEYQNQMTEGIADGIDQYFTS